MSRGIRRRGLVLAALLAMSLEKYHRVFERGARLIEGGNFAAGAEPGVNGQHAPVAQRRLKEKAPQVAGENAHRVVLGFVG
jgi:hypothetical protein